MREFWHMAKDKSIQFDYDNYDQESQINAAFYLGRTTRGVVYMVSEDVKEGDEPEINSFWLVPAKTAAEAKRVVRAEAKWMNRPIKLTASKF